MPNLEQLELGDDRGRFPSRVTDAGLMLLAEAPRLRKLRLRRDDSRRITTAGIARLKERLPNLEIEEF
jgi:hypothetical protein